jgi:hypothetical protein
VTHTSPALCISRRHGQHTLHTHALFIVCSGSHIQQCQVTVPVNIISGAARLWRQTQNNIISDTARLWRQKQYSSSSLHMFSADALCSSHKSIQVLDKPPINQSNCVQPVGGGLWRLSPSLAGPPQRNLLLVVRLEELSYTTMGPVGIRLCNGSRDCSLLRYTAVDRGAQHLTHLMQLHQAVPLLHMIKECIPRLA